MEREGATTTDPEVFAGVPPRALALVPRAMQPNADRVAPSRITFVGPCPGERIDLDILGTIPAGVEVHRWVPQLAILHQVDLFVTHAGMGGCGEGLLTATPMIAVPQDVDQFANADTLVALGVARRIDTVAATSTTLREAAEALLDDPAVRARSAELALRARGEGGTPRSADLLEEELSRG